MVLDNKAARLAYAKCGKTVTQCADEYGCTENHIYHLLAHKGKINPYTAGRFAMILNVDVETIIREVDE